MEWISLKATYLAVLWLVEEKLKISEKGRFGEWNLQDADAKELCWSREKVALQLPPTYFDNSLYGSESDDLLELSNIVDGDFSITGETEFAAIEEVNQFTKAHLILVQLLQESKVIARSKSTLALFPDEIIEFKNSTMSYEMIDKDLWCENPLPSYQTSALHLGKQQQKYIFLKFKPEDRKPILNLMAEGFEYWLTNVEIQRKEFETWLVPQLPAKCFLPEKATLKPYNGKFLIHFGEEYGEYAANKGLQYIHLIMIHGKAFDISDKGISLNLLKYHFDGTEFSSINHDIDELSSKEFSNSNSSSTETFNELDHDGIKRLISYRIKHLCYFIEKYWEIREPLLECDLEEIDERLILELDERKAKSLNWAKGTDWFLSKYIKKDRIYHSLAKKLLDSTEPPKPSELGESFKTETTEEEKNMGAFRKAIQREILRLSKDFPKFARHLGKGTTDSTSGIIVKKSAFSYLAGGEIDWTLE